MNKLKTISYGNNEFDYPIDKQIYISNVKGMNGTVNGKLGEKQIILVNRKILPRK